MPSVIASYQLRVISCKSDGIASSLAFCLLVTRYWACAQTAKNLVVRLGRTLPTCTHPAARGARVGISQASCARFVSRLHTGFPTTAFLAFPLLGTSFPRFPQPLLLT